VLIRPHDTAVRAESFAVLVWFARGFFRLKSRLANQWQLRVVTFRVDAGFVGALQPELDLLSSLSFLSIL